MSEISEIREPLCPDYLFEQSPIPTLMVSIFGGVVRRNLAAAEVFSDIPHLEKIATGMVQELQDSDNNVCTRCETFSFETGVRIFELTMWSIINDQKEIYCYGLHAIDVTEREVLEWLVDTLVHDLRNPLVNFNAGLDLIKEYFDSEKEHVHDSIDVVLEVIKESSKKMGRMIRCILEMKRGIIQGINIETIQVGEFINIVQEDLQCYMEEKSITINISGSFPSIRGNPVMIEHVFYNLLSNAIKNSQGGSHIEIRAEEKQGTGMVRFSVSNPGNAIPPEVLENIFTPFVKGADSNGYGLGLYIVRKAVELMGGEVGVESKEGKNTFWFTLPVAS